MPLLTLVATHAPAGFEATWYTGLTSVLDWGTELGQVRLAATGFPYRTRPPGSKPPGTRGSPPCSTGARSSWRHLHPLSHLAAPTHPPRCPRRPSHARCSWAPHRVARGATCTLSLTSR
jgi:hypothetical protein